MTVRTRLERVDVLASFLLYGLGTGSLFAADIVIGQRLAGDSLSEWAFLRSAVFIGASFAAVGIDQALIRKLVEPKRLLKGSLVQVGVLSLPVFVLSAFLFDWTVAALGYACSVALALSLIFAGFHRALFRIAESQVAVHLWKTPFFVAVVAVLFGAPGLRVGFALLLVLVPWVVFTAFRVLTADFGPGAGVELRQLYPVGARFWLSSMVASSAIYLHQIVLNVDGQSAASAQYFLFATVFLPVPTFVAGFLGNVLNPYMRQEGNQMRDGLRRKMAWFALLVLSTTVGGAIVGLVLGSLLGRFDGIRFWWLALGLVSISALRTAYVVPSGLLGVFGNRRELVQLAIGSAISIGSMLVVYPVMRLLNATALVSILVAVALASAGRLMHAGRLALSIIESGRELKVGLE